MGEPNTDKCIFCGRELEEFCYGRFSGNGERAVGDHELNICKICSVGLKNLLEAVGRPM